MTFELKGKGVKFEYADSFTEEDFEKIMDNIEVLSQMVKTQNQILRHMLEKSPPMFASIVQKFLTLNFAFNESVQELQSWMNNLCKESWALKFGKEGGA